MSDLSPRNVAVFIGSLRQQSLNRKLAHALIQLAPAAQLSLSIVEIGQLPMFNEDWEAAPPAGVAEFKAQIRAADAVLFLTPEYNRSVPGVLKNAIDVGSRPYGQSAWNGKPGGIISTSQGAMGGFGANHHLRQSFVFLNVPTLTQPEAYVGNMAQLFDDSGALNNESTKAFLQQYLLAFRRWIDNHPPA